MLIRNFVPLVLLLNLTRNHRKRLIFDSANVCVYYFNTELLDFCVVDNTRTSYFSLAVPGYENLSIPDLKGNYFPRSAIATLAKAEILSEKFKDGELFALSSKKPRSSKRSDPQIRYGPLAGNDDWKLKWNWEVSKD